MSASRLVQNAIASVLASDATLATLSLTQDVTTVEVFNDVPTGQPFPHVLISGASETPWHTMGGASSGLGWKVIVRIHTYSRYQGDKEAMQINERIVSLLNYQALTVTGYATVIVQCEQNGLKVQDIEKVETRHIVSEFCVMVHQ